MARARNDGETMAIECTPRNNTSPAIRSGIAESSLLAAWRAAHRLDRGAVGLGRHGFALGCRHAGSLLAALCRNCGFLGSLRRSGPLRGLRGLEARRTFRRALLGRALRCA